MKDLNTLRPFAFNLQRHLIEKVQGYLDHCMLHLGTNTGDKQMVGVYQKKAKFFNRRHPICDELPRPLTSEGVSSVGA
jgi:hypothetical protein